MIDFQKKIDRLKEESRYRSLQLPAGIDLTSNDYLGMAVHPELRDTAIRALQGDVHVGSAGSRLLRGHTQAHQNLEEYAATYFKAGKALYLSSGFTANYALLTTLPHRQDIIIYDSLVHASMREGLSAVKSKSFKFEHNDLNTLEGLLKRYSDQAETIWIAVESVYSMDGDCAPLDQIYALADKYDAMLIVDEAHGTGICGEQGKGVKLEPYRCVRL